MCRNFKSWANIFYTAMWPRSFRGQGVKSGSVGRDIWLGFRDVVFLKEVCHWDWVL